MDQAENEHVQSCKEKERNLSGLPNRQVGRVGSSPVSGPEPQPFLCRPASLGHCFPIQQGMICYQLLCKKKSFRCQISLQNGGSSYIDSSGPIRVFSMFTEVYCDSPRKSPRMKSRVLEWNPFPKSTS